MNKILKQAMMFVLATAIMFNINSITSNADEIEGEYPVVIGQYDGCLVDSDSAVGLGIDEKLDSNMKLISVTEEKLDDGSVLVTELYEENNNEGIQPFSTNKSKTVSKRLYIRTSKGTVRVQMALTASFQYNGKSSRCTKAIARVEKCSKPYTITKYYPIREGNKGRGYFTILKNRKSFITNVVTLTCSKNGIVR